MGVPPTDGACEKMNRLRDDILFEKAETACVEAIAPYRGGASVSPESLYEMRQVCERLLREKWPREDLKLYLGVDSREPTALNLSVSRSDQ